MPKTRSHHTQNGTGQRAPSEIGLLTSQVERMHVVREWADDKRSTLVDDGSAERFRLLNLHDEAEDRIACLMRAMTALEPVTPR